jgi:hypothetical protein
MYPSRRLGTLASVALSAVLLAGCAATMNVSSYVERGMDVARYRTYSWAPAEQLVTGDPRLDNNPFFDELVRREVDGQLARRGFERDGSGSAELVLHYHANVTQKIQNAELDRDYNYCEGDACRPYVYDAGTLLIDLVDAKTNKLVWRGWAEGSLEGVIDDQDWMNDKVDEAVTRIFEQLPGRL